MAKTECLIWEAEELAHVKGQLLNAKNKILLLEAVVNDLSGKRGMQTGDTKGNSLEWRTKFVLCNEERIQAVKEQEILKSLVRGANIRCDLYKQSLQRVAADIPAARQNTPVSYLQGIAKEALEI